MPNTPKKLELTLNHDFSKVETDIARFGLIEIISKEITPKPMTNFNYFGGLLGASFS